MRSEFRLRSFISASLMVMRTNHVENWELPSKRSMWWKAFTSTFCKLSSASSRLRNMFSERPYTCPECLRTSSVKASSLPACAFATKTRSEILEGFSISESLLNRNKGCWLLFDPMYRAGARMDQYSGSCNERPNKVYANCGQKKCGHRTSVSVAINTLIRNDID